MADTIGVNPHSRHAFIELEKLDSVLQVDPLLFVLLFGLTAWFLYRLILKDVTPERHRNLRALFKNLLIHSIIAVVLFVLFEALRWELQVPQSLSRILPYIGVVALVWGAIVFIKACRIYAFEYLFLLNMQVGVPLLLVNLLTLLLGVIVGSWILSSVFQFQLASLLAGSAILSVVLGLALQETLGNLFAGIALQIDKPYAIGDWVELAQDAHRVLGRIHEITWRATVLIATTDEVITIPNRMMAQAQISNFSGRHRPITRSQVFRIPYSESLEKARELMVTAIVEMPGIRKHPGPSTLITEANEHYVILKLFYSPEDFGDQFRLADQVLSRVLTAFTKANFPIASQRLDVKLDKASV